jgi:hypothetical protein
MNFTNAWTVALAGLTSAGVITWAWLAVARVMNDLRSINNFEGMHLEE